MDSTAGKFARRFRREVSLVDSSETLSVLPWLVLFLLTSTKLLDPCSAFLLLADFALFAVSLANSCFAVKDLLDGSDSFRGVFAPDLFEVFEIVFAARFDSPFHVSTELDAKVVFGRSSSSSLQHKVLELSDACDDASLPEVSFASNS